MTDNDPPPGWNYNPSSWTHRLPIVALALVGFGIATYLALYQLGVFATVFEPIFGDGSRRILHSSISKLLPIPDAALGAIGYTLDIVSGVAGGRDRWRKMPWIVMVFALVVGLLGLGSVVLVSFQLFFGALCTLCLASAMISIVLPFFVSGEVRASFQHIQMELARGRSLWRVLWGEARHGLAS